MRLTHRIFACLVGFLTLLAVVALSASAAPSHSARFVIGKASYEADGVTKKMDAVPFIANGRTYVPVRYLALALGVPETGIGWDAKARAVTLTLDGVTLKFVIGSKTFYVNGQPKQMDVAPVIKSGRTYLPARWVAEAFGYEVHWDAGTKTVLVCPPGQVVKPDQPVGYKIDWSAAKNGTLQPPPGAVAPPDVWGFPAKAVRMEFKVGSRYTKVTRPDGSTYTLDLGVAPVFVIARDNYPVVGTAEGYKAWLIENYGKTVGYNSENVVIALNGKENTALYVPFIPVAEAFGVPRENIVWDGEHLAVFGWDAVNGYRNGYLAFKAGSKESPAKWHDGAVTLGHLEFPLFVKDGVPMVGINSVDDFQCILYRVPGSYCSLVNIWPKTDGGWDYETGIAATSGELY